MSDFSQQKRNAEMAKQGFSERVASVLDSIESELKARTSEPLPIGPPIRVSVCSVAGRVGVDRTTFRAEYHKPLVERIHQLQKLARDPKASQKARLGIVSSSPLKSKKISRPGIRLKELLRRDEQYAIEQRLSQREQSRLNNELKRLQEENAMLRRFAGARRMPPHTAEEPEVVLSRFTECHCTARSPARSWVTPASGRTRCR